MPTALESAQHVLQTQPFSVLLAAQLTAFSADCVEIRVPITAQIKQQFGFVHGGVISYAADNALTFAGGYALGPSIVTSEFKINYVRPAKGETLIARAHVVYAGQSQAMCLPSPTATKRCAPSSKARLRPCARRHNCISPNPQNLSINSPLPPT